MKEVLKSQEVNVLSVGPGEDLIEEMKIYCNRENIHAGSFTALGAVRSIELAWYDVDAKEYSNRKFEELLEIASLLGNIGLLNNEIVVHAHGVFSDRNMKTYGGHVNSAIVSAACEVSLTVLDGKLEREFSEEIGLNLLKGQI